jgi:hypothetical protein
MSYSRRAVEVRASRGLAAFALVARARRLGSIAIRLLATALVAAAGASTSRAQEIGPVDAKVNYVYATQFGFGGYKVGGLRSDVYSIPIGFTIDDVLGDWDLEVGIPITYGRFRFSASVPVLENGMEVGSAFVRLETNTMATEPKLQLNIPVPAIPGLRISPLGAFGFGGTFATDATIQREGVKQELPTSETGFYTYQIGISTMYTRRFDEFLLLVGNAFIYAGDATFDSTDDTVEGYGTFKTGVEGRYPLGFSIGEFVPDAGAFLAYNLFTPSLQFSRVERRALEIDQIFEVGGTIGASQPFTIPWVPEMVDHALDDFRLGVGYQTGEDLDGVRLTFGFPF